MSNAEGPNEAFDATVIQDVLQGHSKKGLHALHSALLMAASDAVPSRRELFEPDKVDTPLCPRCGLKDDDCVHKFWECLHNSSVNCPSDDVNLSNDLAQYAAKSENHM